MATEWPLPKFSFSITIYEKEHFFQEVVGLETETKPIEFRHGDSKQFAPVKMPGLKKVGNVTLKTGVFVKDNTFWEWHSKIKMNTVERETVIIKLLDEGGNPTMVWTLQNAFPIKFTSSDLKSEGNEVAVESLEIAFETMIISAS